MKTRAVWEALWKSDKKKTLKQTLLENSASNLGKLTLSRVGDSIFHTLTLSFMELGPSCEAANCAAFYGPRTFITVFTRALHWSLS
jgi:hypothetical protein